MVVFFSGRIAEWTRHNRNKETDDRQVSTNFDFPEANPHVD